MEDKNKQAFGHVSASSAKEQAHQRQMTWSQIQTSQQPLATIRTESIARRSALSAKHHKMESPVHAASKSKRPRELSSTPSRQDNGLRSKRSSSSEETHRLPSKKAPIVSIVQSIEASTKASPGISKADPSQNPMTSRSQDGNGLDSRPEVRRKRPRASNLQVWSVDSAQAKTKPLATGPKTSIARKEQRVRREMNPSAQSTKSDSAWHVPLTAPQQSPAIPPLGGETGYLNLLSDFMLHQSTQTATRAVPDCENRVWNPKSADPSIDSNGYQFLPRFSDGHVRLPGPMDGRFPRPSHLPTKLGVGIETEFLLARRRPPSMVTNVKTFGALLARDHNLMVPLSFPRMHSAMAMQDYYLGHCRNPVEPHNRPQSRTHSTEPDQPLNWPQTGGLNEWCLAFDETVYTRGEPCELLSDLPISNYGSTIVWLTKPF